MTAPGDVTAPVDSDPQTALGAALAYAEIGWRVFPCRPDKTPYYDRQSLEHGHNDATIDPTQIREWWTRYPDAQIGVACGASGLCVVDLDVDNAAGLDGVVAFEVLGGLNPAGADLIARTPRGGRHLFYRMPDGELVTSSVGTLARGVDVRAHGGYVIVPGPASPGREWLDGEPVPASELSPPPVWLVELLPRKRAASSSEAPRRGKVTVNPKRAFVLDPRQVDAIRRALPYVCNDEREDWLRVGMALHSTGAHQQAYDLWVEWSRTTEHSAQWGTKESHETHPKFNEADQRSNWSSFVEYFPDGTEITLATLFYMAKENGYEPTSDQSTADDAAIEKATVPVAAPSAREAPDPFAGRWLSITDDWLDFEPPAQRWLLRGPRNLAAEVVGFLARGIVGLLAGAGGVGKTQAMVGLAVAVATGGAWFGYFDVDDGAGKVLLLAAEEDADEMRRRIHRATRSLDDAQRAAVRERIIIAPFHGEDAALLARGRKGTERTAFFEKLLQRLIDEAGPDGWALVAIGPLSRIAGLPIDVDNQHATVVVQALERLSTVRGCPTVIVDCHTNAASRKKGAEDDDVTPRGPTGLYDGARCCMALVRRHGARDIEFRVTKNNRAPVDRERALLIEFRDGILVAKGTTATVTDRREQAIANHAAELVAAAARMEGRILAALRDLGGTTSAKDTVFERVPGKTGSKRAAFAALLDRGDIVASGSARRTIYTLRECVCDAPPTPPYPAGAGADSPPRPAGGGGGGMGRNGADDPSPDGLDRFRDREPTPKRRSKRRRAKK